MSTAAAGLNAVKRFRLHEIKGLQHHLKRYGPLPEKADANPKALQLPNPFLPRFNPTSGRWAPPKYSLRRQAELVNWRRPPRLYISYLQVPIAGSGDTRSSGKEPKAEFGGEEESSGERVWLSQVEWVGKVNERRVKGADSVHACTREKKRMFKGHKWERVKRRRYGPRIKRYKIHKNRRPNPLDTPQANKKAKLPF
ncbi:hypothetical protein EV421DRAFT_1888185 [Armillaria borealis]|uniref:Large ribosomal subunit protein mL59 domain-containing protein n=1 Tax=Armillaria borealis TaxID=47425 RepID=A0AA39K141_9AGAR|nr:hypothetical protein EV421DRAFT_1888185 [Armillaria borealis]